MNAFLFCVCVFKSSDTGDYKIPVVTDIQNAVSNEKALDTLLYIRHYSSMQEAIGHKLFLESLSAPSLENQIRAINPKLRDIKEIFK